MTMTRREYALWRLERIRKSRERDAKRVEPDVVPHDLGTDGSCGPVRRAPTLDELDRRQGGGP